MPPFKQEPVVPQQESSPKQYSQETADRLIEEGYVEAVAINIASYKGLTYDTAIKLIKSGFVDDVRNNLKSFEGLSPEQLDEIREEYESQYYEESAKYEHEEKVKSDLWGGLEVEGEEELKKEVRMENMRNLQTALFSWRKYISQHEFNGQEVGFIPWDKDSVTFHRKPEPNSRDEEYLYNGRSFYVPPEISKLPSAEERYQAFKSRKEQDINDERQRRYQFDEKGTRKPLAPISLARFDDGTIIFSYNYMYQHHFLGKKPLGYVKKWVLDRDRKGRTYHVLRLPPHNLDDSASEVRVFRESYENFLKLIERDVSLVKARKQKDVAQV